MDDLRAFGMIPEFIGRLPIIFTLNGLTEDMMVQILKEPKNAILKQYQKLLALDEVKLDLRRKRFMPLQPKQWKNTQEPELFGLFWRNICWILCMRFRKMTISVRYTEL